MRTFPIIALAALVLAGCGSHHDAAAPTTPAAVPSPTYDGSTLGACKEADLTIDTSDPDFRHAQAARSFAALSDVTALREVAERYTDVTQVGTPIDDAHALTAAVTISTWCLQHGVKAK